MSHQHTSIEYFRKLRRAEFVLEAILVIAVLAALFSVSSARADVTFGASVTNADGELLTTLTWDAPGASECTGAGHPSWAGEKSVAGSQALPTITLSGTYQLSLACSFPGDATAKVSWTNPMQNTDGTPYANPAGTRIYYGQDASALVQAVQVSNSTATSYVIENLAPGTWYFAARAYNTNGAESAQSNVASKVLAAATREEASVALTVNPVPQSPLVEVE